MHNIMYPLPSNSTLTMGMIMISTVSSLHAHLPSLVYTAVLSKNLGKNAITKTKRFFIN